MVSILFIVTVPGPGVDVCVLLSPLAASRHRCPAHCRKKEGLLKCALHLIEVAAGFYPPPLSSPPLPSPPLQRGKKPPEALTSAEDISNFQQIASHPVGPSSCPSHLLEGVLYIHACPLATSTSGGLTWLEVRTCINTK